MNKMQMYIQLQERIYTGFGTELLMVDSPFQNKDFAPYVVVELVRRTPQKDIATNVLNAIAKDIEFELVNPSLGSKLFYAIFRFYESYRLNKQVVNYKRSNVYNLNKNSNKPKR